MDILTLRKSRLEAVRAVNKWREEYESLRQQALEIRRNVERKDQEITAAMSRLQNLNQKMKQYDDSLEPLKMELRVKTTHLEKQRGQLEAILQRKENVERLLKEHSENISALEAEMSSDFKKALTANEERQLEQLNNTIQDLQKQWNDLSNSRREIRGPEETPGGRFAGKSPSEARYSEQPRHRHTFFWQLWKPQGSAARTQTFPEGCR